MGRKKPDTPRSQIKRWLDRLWLGSRERSAALKRTNYCCEKCGVKQSAAKGREVKIQVHHVDGCDRNELVDLVKEKLLHGPERLMPLCKACHDKEHGK